MSWRIKKLIKKMPLLNNPVLIEGLPGIGNVGKVAVDFMIDELKAEKMLELTSFSLPHSVFVDENNLVELPVIEVFYKKFNGKDKRDVIFLSGDIQPVDEVSSYEFAHTILDLLKQLKGTELITIGGIGLPNVPEKPKVYCTGNSSSYVKSFKKGTKINDKLYGIVGPIVGVTGLLVGLASEKEMKGLCLLAETYGHPLYLGMKGSQEILAVLNKKFGFNLDLKALHKEIKDVEQELLKRTEQLQAVSSKGKKGPVGQEASYIG
jgi:uncharacterized protein